MESTSGSNIGAAIPDRELARVVQRTDGCVSDRLLRLPYFGFKCATKVCPRQSDPKCQLSIPDQVLDLLANVSRLPPRANG
jgi:hypothetical protein